MHITANGKTLQIEAGTTLQALLATLKMDGSRVAVERNRGIVPRDAFATILLAEGDVLEIVQFVGGG